MAKAYPEYGRDLAGKIALAMKRRGFSLFTNPGETNIIYIEGMNPDGTPNDNKPNVFNDLRTVLTFSAEGVPILLGKWEATTEPSAYFTYHSIAGDGHGAARIQFGEHRAWQVGMHRGNHEALIQTGGPVTITRDDNKDFKREGDRVETGYFGINQHWGYDAPHDDIGRTSAGCLVGRTKEGHREFMSIVKSDPRYRKDHGFIFSTCILTAKEVSE